MFLEQLPDKVVESCSIQSFDRRLDKHWRGQDMIFNYEAALTSEIVSQTQL